MPFMPRPAALRRLIGRNLGSDLETLMLAAYYPAYLLRTLITAWQAGWQQAGDGQQHDGAR